MDQELKSRLDALEAKVNDIWQSVEKTRKYFQVTLWVTLILFVLPLFGLFFAVPKVMNSYLSVIDVGQFEELQGL